MIAKNGKVGKRFVNGAEWRIPKPFLEVADMVGSVTVSSSIIKLFAALLLALTILQFMGLSGEANNIVIIAEAMPNMMNSAVILKQFGGDNKLASVVVLATTLLCLASIPLIIVLFEL